MGHHVLSSIIMDQKTMKTVTLLCAVGSLVLLLLSDFLTGSYWGLFCLIPYAAVPCLAIGVNAVTQDPDPTLKLNQWGYFTESALWITTFFIPLVSHAVGNLNVLGVILVFAANIAILAAYFMAAKL